MIKLAQLLLEKKDCFGLGQIGPFDEVQFKWIPTSDYRAMEHSHVFSYRTNKRFRFHFSGKNTGVVYWGLEQPTEYDLNSVDNFFNKQKISIIHRDMKLNLIKEKLSLKSILLEYISSPIVDLKQYLTQTEAEKKTELGLGNDCLEFLGKNYPEIYEKYIQNIYYESSEKKLMKEYPDVFNAWCDFLYDKLKRNDNYRYFERGYPTWYYVDYRSIVKNQWLIHFSDYAEDIYHDQKFNRGVYDYTTLGLTTHLPDSMKDGIGYNFAFLLSDYMQYGSGDMYHRGRWTYGKEAVLFKASGVKVWHYGDQQPQVIFWGPSAFDIVCIREHTSSGDYYVYSNHSRDLFVGDFDDCVNWVVNNFNQYKRVLLP
jgi:hypothetical protein